MISRENVYEAEQEYQVILVDAEITGVRQDGVHIDEVNINFRHGFKQVNVHEYFNCAVHVV